MLTFPSAVSKVTNLQHGHRPVFYIEPVRRPQADNFQPGLATLLLAGPTGWQLFV